MTNDALQEYEFKPPNIMAIQWDGSEAAARAILEVSNRFRYTAEVKDGETTRTLFLDELAVRILTWVIQDPSQPNTLLMGPQEFRQKYQPVPPPRIMAVGSETDPTTKLPFTGGDLRPRF